MIIALATLHYLTMAAYMWWRNHLWFNQEPLIGSYFGNSMAALTMGLMWPLSVVPAILFASGFKWWGRYDD